MQDYVTEGALNDVSCPHGVGASQDSSAVKSGQKPNDTGALFRGVEVELERVALDTFRDG